MGDQQPSHRASPLACIPLGKREKLVELETERLVLRDFRIDDWEDVYEYASDPEVMRFSSFEPLTEQEVKKAVSDQAQEVSLTKREVFTLAIELTEQHKVIGTCSLFVQAYNPGEATIHGTIHRNFWHRGIATEALGALLRFAFNDLNLHRVFTRHVAGNAAPGRVLEKTGFKKEGVARDRVMVRGSWHDEYAYSMLDTEWREPMKK